MMFTLTIFYRSEMDGHSKSEVLEIFNANKKFKKSQSVVSFLFSFNTSKLVEVLSTHLEFLID